MGYLDESWGKEDLHGLKAEIGRSPGGMHTMPGEVRSRQAAPDSFRAVVIDMTHDETEQFLRDWNRLVQEGYAFDLPIYDRTTGLLLHSAGTPLREVTFTYKPPHGRGDGLAVMVKGEFNAWREVRMPFNYAKGVYETTLQLLPGQEYAYGFRVERDFVRDENAEKTKDGVNSVIRVPAVQTSSILLSETQALGAAESAAGGARVLARDVENAVASGAELSVPSVIEAGIPAAGIAGALTGELVNLKATHPHHTRIEGYTMPRAARVSQSGLTDQEKIESLKLELGGKEFTYKYAVTQYLADNSAKAYVFISPDGETVYVSEENSTFLKMFNRTGKTVGDRDDYTESYPQILSGLKAGGKTLCVYGSIFLSKPAYRNTRVRPPDSNFKFDKAYLTHYVNDPTPENIACIFKLGILPSIATGKRTGDTMHPEACSFNINKPGDLPGKYIKKFQIIIDPDRGYGAYHNAGYLDPSWEGVDLHGMRADIGGEPIRFEFHNNLSGEVQGRSAMPDSFRAIAIDMEPDEAAQFIKEWDRLVEQGYVFDLPIYDTKTGALLHSAGTRSASERPVFTLSESDPARSLLARDTIDAETTVREYASLLGLEAQYNASAGIGEGFTVGKHTAMVLGQFERYFAGMYLPGVDKGFFRLIVLLHDIGVGEAVRMGNKAQLQHKETTRIVREVMERAGYSAKHIALATTLLNEDFIGRFMQSDITVAYRQGESPAEITAMIIKGHADELGMPVSEFYKLLLILYQCDASAYTTDAGATSSLDFLFTYHTDEHRFLFDMQNGRIFFSPDSGKKISELEKELMKLQPTEPAEAFGVAADSLLNEVLFAEKALADAIEGKAASRPSEILAVAPGAEPAVRFSR